MLGQKAEELTSGSEPWSLPGVRERPLILVTNDDGVGARGLLALERALRPLGEVWVVAPATERSTSSHSLTLRRDLPALDDALAQGDTALPLTWLREQVHRHGRMLEPAELITRATGSAPGTHSFISYIRGKYLG